MSEHVDEDSTLSLADDKIIATYPIHKVEKGSIIGIPPWARACAARVTVRKAGEQSFLLRGKKGGKEGREGGERKRSWCNLKREIQIPINAVHEQR